MSVPSACFQISGNHGWYKFELSSCNPQQPVSFTLPDQAYDPSRLQASGIVGVSGGIRSINITTFPQVAVPTTWNQNPIKLVIYAVSPNGNEYFGNSAVFYGYYLGYGGDGLELYLNQEQSTRGGQYGRAGIDVGVAPSKRSIYLP